MDPLTHTLVGANLSATRLGDRSRFATAALIIGANLPDIDGICYFIDSDLALGFRRGWTHGILALVVLPVLLAAVFVLIDRTWRREDARADFRWLALLSALAIATHPTLDWLNTYGMRWLMPFSGRWFYGDAVFIMDLWLWLILGVGYLAGRRATTPIVGSGILIGAWTIRRVWARSPEYLPLVAGVALIFALMLWWKRPVEDRALARRFAAGALLISMIYIGSRLLLNELAEAEVTRQLTSQGEVVHRLMTGPDPINPMKWSVVAQTDDVYRYGDFHWKGRTLTLQPESVPVARESAEWRRAITDPSVWGLVTWLRFPAYEVKHAGSDTIVEIFDARRMGAGRRSSVRLRTP